MLRVLVLSVVLALAVAVPFVRQKRQIGNNCADYFKTVKNPCTDNPMNKVYFPHPNDTTKFIQCDRYGRMYIIQCPENLTYSVTTATCSQSMIMATTTQGSFQSHMPTTLGHIDTRNPCTPEALTAGNYYFSVQGDETKFIECDMLGHPNVMSCASSLVWNEARLSCVYRLSGDTGSPAVTSGSVGGSITPSGPGSSNLKNPCTAENIAANRLFFPHPDSTKFIQCDLWGDVNVVSCPSGLVWNQYSETCASAFITVNGGAGK